jgi:hypothetical protein
MWSKKSDITSENAYNLGQVITIIFVFIFTSVDYNEKHNHFVEVLIGQSVFCMSSTVYKNK